MAVYNAGKDDVVVFEPADGTVLGPLRVTESYIAETHGVRVAVIQTLYDAEADDLNRLRTGLLGRLTIRHRDGPAELDAARTIPVGALTCLGITSEVRGIVRKTLVIVEVYPPEDR